MSNKLKKFIKYLQNVKPSEKERSVLRSKIEEFIAFNPIRGEVPIPKTHKYISIFTIRNMIKGVSLALSVLIIVGGAGVSYASQDTLPGDRLYKVKINITEEIEETLAITKDAKIQVQANKVERRLSEAQTLVNKKTLSPENKIIVKENLERNVEKITKTIEKLEADEALNATSKIAPVLEAHRNTLEDKTRGSEEEDLLETVNNAIKKVEATEEKIIEEINENPEEIERVTENNKTETFKKIEDIKKTQQEATKKVGSEIISTEKAITESDIEAVKDLISSEEDVNRKISEAKEYILDAEDKEAKGEYKEALILSQKAKKIVEQIDAYKKIKLAEEKDSKEASEKEAKEKEAEDIGVKEEVPETTEDESVKVEETTETEIKETPEDILRAQVIKSIEETKNKLNFSQSTRTPLP